MKLAFKKILKNTCLFASLHVIGTFDKPVGSTGVREMTRRTIRVRKKSLSIFINLLLAILNFCTLFYNIIRKE